MKILNVVGARPNFIKIAPIIEQMKQSPRIVCTLLHTGQHYDENMNAAFFNQLNIPSPDINLGIKDASNVQQIAQVLQKFEPIVLREKPHAILVVGDVNSTLACSMVAAYHKIKIIHVEAGLRSFDLSMPEEINRMLTDKISDLLFVTESSAVENLKKEGIDPNKIHVVGNVMVDTLLKYKTLASESSKILDLLELQPKQYALLTLHRPENVDDKNVLQGILETVVELSQKISIVFPIHPRTKNSIYNFKLNDLLRGLKLTPPLSYFDMVQLMQNSKLVLTDSGGIQEETTILDIPCLTLRKNTERPITVKEGTNVVVGTQKADILLYAFNALKRVTKAGKYPELWDGSSAKRIVGIIENWGSHLL
jgi:UDP-N-acetylglucosamine 2-epimerase (non-hydrolysing)